MENQFAGQKPLELEKRNASLLSIVIIVALSLLVVIIGAVLLINTTREATKTVVEKSGYTLEANYNNDNTWDYTLTGQLPTQCYAAATTVDVVDTFPESVTVTLTITPPEPNVACDLIIFDLEIEGEFSASKSMILNLEVVEVPGNAPNEVIDQTLFNSADRSITVSDVSAYANYLGENKWEYVAAGYKPSACHSVSSELLIQEKFPEHVLLEITFTEDPDAEVCIQVLESFEVTGEFTADEDASFDIAVYTI